MSKPACHRNFRVVAAAAVGRQHEKEGRDCQDVVKAYINSRIAIVVLADGAGSAPHARMGAELVSRIVVRHLKQRFNRLIRKPETAARHEIAREVIVELQKRAESMRIPIHDLACTMLFGATNGKFFLFGQMGDGRIGIQDQSEQWRVLDASFKGEFYNETQFVTSAKFSKGLVLAKGPAQAVRSCVLMSDGAEEALFQRASAVFAPAVDSMLSWTKSHPKQVVERSLIKNLRDVIRLRTLDDVSLAMICRHP